MKIALLLLLASGCAPGILIAQETKAAPPAAPSTATPEETERATKEAEQLLAAAKIGSAWQGHVKSGDLAAGMSLWGYTAFDGITAAQLQARLAAQSRALGPLIYSDLLEDRCLIDLGGAPSGKTGETRGVYLTLRYYSEFEKGSRRESLILHEPAKGGKGLKITGLRREELPTGRQGAFELAASLGQLALLKLRGAPARRWTPYQREAAALAGRLKLTLPSIPDSAGSGDTAAGEKLVNLVMVDATALVEKLGAAGGVPEAKAILNAFAVLMLYTPGEETITRLAVLCGSEAEKAKLPAELWKPLIKAVSEKEKLPVVHEAVQNMVAGVSQHLAKQQRAIDLKLAPREILETALANMAQLPSYQVRGELTAADGRRCVMDAALGKGAMDLTLQGFDGRRERRLVTGNGFRISRNEGKTWEQDNDPDTATGLCRTLQAPLDLSLKVTEKFTFAFAGEEKIDGESLYRFERSDAAGEPALIYWVLMSRSGPVIRRARTVMKFGDVETDALLIYTRLGKPVDIPDPGAAAE